MMVDQAAGSDEFAFLNVTEVDPRRSNTALDHRVIDAPTARSLLENRWRLRIPACWPETAVPRIQHGVSRLGTKL